jgi:hypothetical protein
MSVATFLHLEALEHVKQDLITYKNKLQQLIELDVEKAKADLQTVVAHFEAEYARIRAAIEPKVLAHLDEGASPQQAVNAAANNVPTKAELAAKV